MNTVDAEIKYMEIIDKRGNIEFVSKAPPELFNMATNGYEQLGKMVNIQVSSACQLACKGCRGSFDNVFLNEVSNQSFIPHEKFKLIVSRCISSGIKCIELTPAIGDPMLDKDIINKILYLQSLPEIELIILTTNLIKFDPVDYCKLLSCDKLALYISVYGSDSVSYEEETGRDLYDRFILNFKKLYECVKKHKIAGYIQLTNRTKWLLADIPKTHLYYLLHLFLRQDRVSVDCSEVFNINRGGAVTRKDLSFVKGDLPERSGLCPHGPGLGGGILPNGDVLFCPFNDIYRQGVIGNIFKQDLKDIYNDKPFKTIVENHEQNIYNGICESCNESW